MTLARELVRRVRALQSQPLPPQVSRAARLHLLDAAGVGLAAAGSPVGIAWRNYGRDVPVGPASVFGMGGATPAEAALMNGGLIHSLEFDDTHTGSIVHGSAVLAAAALAAGEANGATGPALLGAYALGWEILVRFGLAAPGAFQARGFQVTSVAGALAAALVAAALGGLDEDAMTAALGISLSQAAGVFEFLSNGSSVKALHPGWAAHAGLIAARLASAGMTGPETSLEGRFGLFAAFAGDASAPERFRASLSELGQSWALPDAAFKFLPCCHYLHPFVEAAGALESGRISPASIERLVCGVPPGVAPIICEPWLLKQNPTTPHAARWSLPIVVAARLVEGRVDLATFEREASAEVRALAARIRWEPLEDTGFPRVFAAVITCETKDGERQTVRIDDVYGNVGRPPAEQEVRQKFRTNAARSLTPPAAAALESAIDGLGGSGGLGALTAALRGECDVERKQA